MLQVANEVVPQNKIDMGRKWYVRSATLLSKNEITEDESGSPSANEIRLGHRFASCEDVLNLRTAGVEAPILLAPSIKKYHLR